MTDNPHQHPDESERHATNLVDMVYGNETLRFDDPGENWFEASKIYRETMPWDAPGVAKLQGSPALQTIATRAGKRYTNRPLTAFPTAPVTPLMQQMRQRYSDDTFAPGTVSLIEVTAIFEAGYGVVDRGGCLRRPIPSGGALYPLDVFLLARNMDGIGPGLYHVDPFRRVYASLGPYDDQVLLQATLRPEALANMAFSIIICASFWRSRFKYGTRAYRFVLIEAGHLMQNMLLMASSLGLGSRPYGGFIDQEMTDLLPGYNGVDEAPIYLLIGGRRTA